MISNETHDILLDTSDMLKLLFGVSLKYDNTKQR